MDFAGQKLSEALAMYIVLAGAALGFLWGYVRQDFGEMMGLFAGSVVVALALTVPDWPIYNKHPLTWLPPQEQADSAQQKRRGGGEGNGDQTKKVASWQNLWGVF